MSSVSNGLYFLTLLLVSVMRVTYTSKGKSKKFGGARYTLGARYLYIKRNVRSLECALYIRCVLSIEKYGNNLKKEKSAFGKLPVFNWDRFAFIYSIIEFCVLEHLSFHCSVILQLLTAVT